MKKVLLLFAGLLIAGPIVNISAMENIGELLELIEKNNQALQKENQKVPRETKAKIVENLENAAQQVQELVEPRNESQNIGQQHRTGCNRKCLGIALGCGVACAAAICYIRTHYDNLTWKELHTILSESFKNSYF